MPRETNAALPQPVLQRACPTQDPAAFTVPPDDQKLYTGIEELLKKDVVGFEKSTMGDADVYPLRTAWGPAGATVLEAVEVAGQIVFHALGDSGASMARTFPSEIKVADAITADFHASKSRDRPAFLYNLGDVVYNFGESAYYYDQLYDPYLDYPAPILAIPGNDDWFIVPNTRPGSEPLTIFKRNFCAASPVVTQDRVSPPDGHDAAGRLLCAGRAVCEDHRAVQQFTGRSRGHLQPGWNVGRVPDFQLDFLSAQLRRIRTESFKGAVIIAVHHPPFSYAPRNVAPSGKHAGNSVMLGRSTRSARPRRSTRTRILSGHAHNYQRYTRTLRVRRQEHFRPLHRLRERGTQRQPAGQHEKRPEGPGARRDADVG